MTVDKEEMTKKPGFWVRQLGSDVPTSQVVFDVVLGIVGPILCLIFDPFVFTDRLGTLVYSPLVEYRVFAYLGMGIGLIGLGIWLGLGQRLSIWKSFIVGILFVGALFSSIVGIVLFPFSIFGLLILVGVFGFLPFIVAFIYFRNGVRAAREIRQIYSTSNKAVLGGLFLLGLVVVIGLPGYAQWQSSRYVLNSLELVLHGNPVEVQQGVTNLQAAFWCTDWCYSEIRLAYETEQDPERRAQLAGAYKKLTGDDLEIVIESFQD
jgi:hypothetical protein